MSKLNSKNRLHRVRIFSFLMFSVFLLSFNSFAQQGFIPGVPDANQPPTNTVIVNTSNYCAPMAATNITGYWDVVIKHQNAVGVNANIGNLKTVAEYVGFFMDTNNAGSGARGNGNDGHLGTWVKDIAPGTLDFVKWNGQANNPQGAPALPVGCQKSSYTWQVATSQNAQLAWNSYVAEINNGFPPVVCFNFWNPNYTGQGGTIGAYQDSVYFYEWGDSISCSQDPQEQWGDEIGHAVTGVGYMMNFDPDGNGPIQPTNWVVVHDNWASTAENVAIPWGHFMALTTVNPNKPPIIIIVNPIFPPPGSYIHRGETMQTELVFMNTGYEKVSFYAWVMVVLPNGTLYGPIAGPGKLPLVPGQVFSYMFRKVIPTSAPYGSYYYTVRIGASYSNENYSDSEGYTFEVVR
jgi:hypothetical protein